MKKTNKILLVLIITIFCSCGSTKIKAQTKKINILNKILDAYTSQGKKAYLIESIIEPQNHNIKTFFESYKKTNSYFDKCSLEIRDSIFDSKELIKYKTQNLTTKKWNYKKIDNPNIIKKIELTRDYSKKQYKEFKKTIKNQDELRIRKMLLWKNENTARLIKVSEPYISSNGTYAFCFLQETNEGDFIYILKNNNNSWDFACKMRLSYH